jgi:hypothetical protein
MTLIEAARFGNFPFYALIPGLPKASPTPGSQVAGAPRPAATSPTPAPVVAADEPAPSRESGT